MSFRSLLDRWQQREAPVLTAAEYAVRQYRFAPARSNGKPVAVWTLVPIEYRLTSD